ncbi:MAG TPA: hypothetical protein VNO22_03585 [Planctomycetota bacterium]|nr:hypothetical protein [Planctomycetota bacterium]
MAAPTFNTLSIELVEHGEATAEYFIQHGYKVKIEPSELAFPSTPALICRRSPTTVIVEVDSEVRQGRLEAWARYARSSTKDVRIALCLPQTTQVSADDDGWLRSKGIGLYVSETGQRNVQERIPPQDLGVNVNLPALDSVHPRLRRILGSVYEQFERSHWREGFEAACQALEVEARRYLIKGTSGAVPRVTVLDAKGNPRQLSAQQIDRMTIGALAAAFGNLRSPNYTDSQIAQALVKINVDRIGVVHHKQRRSTENRLRRNVGQHMWTVIGALKLIMGV